MELTALELVSTAESGDLHMILDGHITDQLMSMPIEGRECVFCDNRKHCSRYHSVFLGAWMGGARVGVER